MEKARTLIVTMTAWLSFLAALWLFFFDIVPWHVPVLTLAVTIFVFGLAAVPPKK